MQGRHAFITGASTGLGRELAKQLAAKGYDLTLLARRKKLLNELKKELKDSGRRILVMQVDVTEWEALQHAVAQAEKENGPIDLLIANAGISHPTAAANFDVQKAREILEVNVLGLMQTVAAVLPGFRARKQGHIVGISSLASYVPLPGFSVYGASKAAVSSYLEALRIELADSPIRVSTVCPGFVKTPMTEGHRFKMPFLMEVEDAARLIVQKIEKGNEWVNFPAPLFHAIQSLKFVPKPLYKALLKKGAATASK